MPQNQPASNLSPYQKAIIGTSLVVLLLGAFATLGYWYGQKRADDITNGSTTNTTTGTTANSADTTAPRAAISGRISKVLGEAIEVTVGSGEKMQIITAKVVSNTTFRKQDLRTIPKNGFGEGTPITFKDLTVGSNVVVASNNVNSNTIDASKISVIIYP